MSIPILKGLSFHFKAFYNHLPSAISLHKRNFMEMLIANFSGKTTIFIQTGQIKESFKL